jgi:hypothetical protein
VEENATLDAVEARQAAQRWLDELETLKKSIQEVYGLADQAPMGDLERLSGDLAEAPLMTTVPVTDVAEAVEVLEGLRVVQLAGMFEHYPDTLMLTIGPLHLSLEKVRRAAAFVGKHAHAQTGR